MKVADCRMAVIVLILLLAASSAQAADVHLSAAASLRKSLDELSNRFARKNRGVRVVKNYGASGSLAKQVESGAPVDIFISGNEQWVNYLKQKKMVSPASVADLAYNTLVFVGRPGTRVSSMKDLLKLERIAIGSPKSAAGEYAMEALKKAYIDKQLEKKLVMVKDVPECMMYAERGEVDGALVYRTDALDSKKVKILFTVPQNLYGRVTYSMALTANGTRNRDAQAFYRYLLGAEAKEVLVKDGFVLK